VKLFSVRAVIAGCGLAWSAAGLHAQPPQQPAAVPGQTAAQRYKNVQVLKDVPAEQLPLAMQYITASLGVGCDFCHVTGPGGAFDKDDKEPKGRAREMMKMMAAINTEQFEGRQTVGCMSCHNGHMRPSRVPGLAVEMTPEEAAAARAGRGGRGGPGGPGRGPGGPGGPGGGPAGPGGPPAPDGQAGPGGQAGRGGPGGAAAPEAPGQPPAGAGVAGQGRGRGQQPPPPSETLEQVLAKYQQALGGKDALARLTTRVMTGTITSRDLQTSNITVRETAAGGYRIDLASEPNPTVRVATGKTGWSSGGFNNQVRDLEGLGLQQAGRLADFGLPLHLTERYEALSVSRYANVDGKPTILVTGRPYPGVTEQLQFDRESGLLLRRSISTATPLGPLPEQIDYTDFRDVAGVKIPYNVRYVTWNAVTAEKLADVKFNTPVGDDLFAKPAAPPR
jgi:hypothetical protein